MIFSNRDIVSILHENSESAFLIIETNKSKYKGEKYNIRRSAWRACILRNNKNAYYHWDTISLTDDTHATFKNLNSKQPHYDYINKEISVNNLLFNKGLWKVELVTSFNLYVTKYKFRNHINNITHNYDNYDMTISISSLHSNSRTPYYRISKANIWKFLLVDNPIDILRIADEDR